MLSGWITHPSRHFVMVRAVVILMGAAFLLLIVSLYFFNPETTPYFPRCTFAAVTGLKCVGCGGQRAVHALLNGDVASAMRYNFFLLTVFPLLIIGLVCGPLKLVKWYPFAVVGIVLLFAVLRNLPGMDF